MGTVKYTGPVASFHCPTNAEIRSLKVHFSPKQEGSGDPSPENVRPIVGWDGVEVEQSGKNLFDVNNPNIISPNCWVSSNTPNIIKASSVDRTVYIKCLPNMTYVISKTLGNVLGAGYTTELPASGIQTYSYMRDNYAKQVIITTGADAKYLAIWFYDGSKIFDKTVQPEDIYKTLQVEIASTATSYEPYHGSTTNYEFGVLGKNKFPASDGTTSDIFLAANTTYTISATSPSPGYFRGWYEDETDTGLIWINVGSDGNRRWKTFTPEKNIIKGLMYVGTGMSECQIELGSTATTYEPYDPNHTVYGGWVDLITGEVVNTHAIYTFTGEEPLERTNYLLNPIGYIFDSRYNNSIGYSSTYELSEVACNKLNFETPRYHNVHKGCIAIAKSNQTVAILFNDTDVFGSTAAEAKAKLAEWYDNGEPMVIAAKLQEAYYVHYHLAPTQLQTFLGQNNVWSNADYIEVEYDLHETQNILARKQFIIANQPHIEKPAAAPLQNFVTDMAAPLKECRVYFNPVQEGSGDPSPENVREIKGWTGILMEQRNKNLLGNLEDGYFRTFIPAETNLTASSDIPASGSNQVRFYRADKTQIDYWSLIQPQIEGRRTRNFTVHEDCYYFDFIHNDLNVQLELGYHPTPYEPYTGATIPITFPSEAGTVYGGYVDLVTGEVWKTYNKIILDGDNIQVNNGSYESNGNYGAGLVYVEPTGESVRYKNGLPLNLWSENIPLYIVNTLPEPPYVYAPLAGALYFVVYVAKVADHPELADKTARKNYVNEWLKQNPITLVYELKTPTIVATLTPTALKTLRGTNNIWSNANGDIEVKYWTH